MYLLSLLTILALIITGEKVSASEICKWVDGQRDDKPALLVSGSCTLDQITPSKYIEEQNQDSILLSASLFVLPKSRLVMNGSTFKNVRLSSGINSYAPIIAEGSELIINNTNISSFDPQTGLPDTNIEDGRAFIRVDAFIDSNGTAQNGFIDIDRSSISHLGYNSIGRDSNFSAYGLSLKVRKEDELNLVQVNGRIRNSTLSYNYRGYYSYGARNIIFESNYVHNNDDYGVDPHDDSDGFIAINNTIVNNGGTGLALSRRCDNSVVSGNKIIGNGNNGILIHDLSNSVVIEDNLVEDNGLDGIVIHDSNQIKVLNNVISNNRNGMRIFAGSTSVHIEGNEFSKNRRTDIFLLNGNLEAIDDLSNYSLGTDWNAQNISRHNDSRVRLVSIEKNTFTSNAVIESIEAELISFSENYYAGDVLFDIKESDRVSLDGAQSQGHVSYRLRSKTDSSSQYAIDAKSGSELSVLNGDRITVLNDNPQFPASNQNFTLEFLNNGEKVISTVSPDRKIQTGILKEIPLSAIKGEVSLSSYVGDFLINGEARIELVSTDWTELVLSINNNSCSIVKLDIEDRFLPAFSKDAFYVQTGVEFQLDDVLEGSRGRVVMDIKCVQS